MTDSELRYFVARLNQSDLNYLSTLIEDRKVQIKIDNVFNATLNDSEQEYFREGFTIQVIKSLRTRLHCSLSVAKMILDKYKQRENQASEMAVQNEMYEESRAKDNIKNHNFF